MEKTNYNRWRQSEIWANIREIIILLLFVFIIRTFGFGLYQVPTGSMETTMLVGGRFFADKFTPLFGNIKRGDIISFNDPQYTYSSNRFSWLFQQYIWGPSNWTKRVIAVPGDEVKGTIEQGKPVIYINGKKLVEPYVNKYPLISVANRRKSYDPRLPLEQQPFYRIDSQHVLSNENGTFAAILPGTPLYSMFKHKPCDKNYWDKSDEFYVKLGKNQYWVMGDNRLASYDSRSFGPLDGSLIHGKILFRIFSIDTESSFLWVDFLKHPIDFFSKVRWSRCFQRVC